MYQPLNQRSSTKGILLGAFLVVACCVFALSYYQVPSFIQLNSVKSYKPSEEAWNIFGEWSKTHNKSYSDPEEMKKRWEIFHNNYYWIKTENAKGYSYTLAVNQFADLTADEFKAMYLRPMNFNEEKQRVNMHLLGLPDSIDWSEKGAVTPVKNQGSCGSCWAFSSTGGLEGAYFVKTGQLQSFSEQQLVDCSKEYQNEGCNGGLMDYSWAYYKDHTAELENDYSYKGKDGTCSHDDSKGLTKITSFVDLATNELALKTALATVGPVSIAVDAVWWQFYFGGIYNGLCGTNLDHGVLAVGYGADSSGKKYWKVKNSWGGSWGEKGYIRVIRGDSATDVGKCGVAMAASYPVL